MRKTALPVPLRHTSWHVLGRSCKFQASGCDLKGSLSFLFKAANDTSMKTDRLTRRFWHVFLKTSFHSRFCWDPHCLGFFFCSVLPDSPGPPLPGWAEPGPESASPPTTGGGASGPSRRPPQRETPPAKWTAPAEGQKRVKTILSSVKAHFKSSLPMIQ